MIEIKKRQQQFNEEREKIAQNKSKSKQKEKEKSVKEESEKDENSEKDKKSEKADLAEESADKKIVVVDTLESQLSVSPSKESEEDKKPE